MSAGVADLVGMANVVGGRGVEVVTRELISKEPHDTTYATYSCHVYL